MINTGDSFFDADIQRDAIEQAEWEEHVARTETEDDYLWRDWFDIQNLVTAPVIEPALSLHCFEF